MRISSLRRKYFVSSSVKESLDNLPMGVCFADDTGVVLLQNRRMSSLSHEITGQDLQDANELWRTVTQGEFTNGTQRLHYGASPVIALSFGTVWMFSRSELDLDGRTVVQILASEITDLDIRRRQLREANEKLTAMNERLRQYGRDTIEVTAREERLNAKVRIHDELGSALIATRYYLSGSSDGTDGEEILDRWRRNIRVLRGSAEEPPRTTAAFIVNAARALGVTLKIEGAIPEGQKQSDIILSAISESLNNAVRHAGATELTASVTEESGSVLLYITNNGRAPEGTVSEGGGLSALRRSVEAAGGSMTLETSPEFGLKIKIPCGKEQR